MYPVLVNIAGYVDSDDRPVPPGLVDDLLATSVYYAYPIVTRINVLGVNVFRRAADVAAVAGSARRAR